MSMVASHPSETKHLLLKHSKHKKRNHRKLTSLCSNVQAVQQSITQHFLSRLFVEGEAAEDATGKDKEEQQKETNMKTKERGEKLRGKTVCVTQTLIRKHAKSPGLSGRLVKSTLTNSILCLPGCLPLWLDVTAVT